MKVSIIKTQMKVPMIVWSKAKEKAWLDLQHQLPIQRDNKTITKSFIRTIIHFQIITKILKN